MIKDENLGILVNALNISDKLNGQEFNENPTIIDAYINLYGEGKYHDCISQNRYNIINAFYSISGSIENEIKNRKVSTTTAKLYIDKITNEIKRNHLLFFVVSEAINRNEIEHAVKLIGLLSKDSPVPANYHGFRLLLKYYAQKCDLENFRKYLKLSKPVKHPKNQVVEAKEMMLSKYAVQHGIQAGLKLCKEKAFGLNKCMLLLEDKAQEFSIQEINELLSNYPIFLESEPHAKAILYVKRFKPNQFVCIDESEFELTLNEISKVDKSIKNNSVRLKDFLLFSLGSSTSTKAQIIACKKMITAPFYKKELNYRLG